MGVFANLFRREKGPTAAEYQAQGARVIDVRTRAEFQSGHVAGARNLDVDSPGFASALRGLNNRYTYVVYCQSGARATGAVAQMQSRGLKAVSGGGLNAMLKNGWELG